MKPKQFRVKQADFILAEFDTLPEARVYKKLKHLVTIERLNRLTHTWTEIK